MQSERTVKAMYRECYKHTGEEKTREQLLHEYGLEK